MIEYRELGRRPITPDQPAGTDVTYEPEFGRVTGEMDKLAIASEAGEGVDWDLVVDLTSRILSEKSKNLQAAAYLARGLIERQKVQGFAAGLTVIKDLVENFWEEMYPPKKRMRGRLNAVAWWLEQVEVFWSGYGPNQPLPSVFVKALKDDLKALDQALVARFEEPPAVQKLMKYIDRLPVMSDEPTPPPAAEGRAATSEAEGAPAAGPPLADQPPAKIEIKTGDDARRVVETGLGQLSESLTFLLENEPANPLVFRLNRIAAWLLVENPPPADGQRTMIPPPDTVVRQSIESLIANGDLENAVKAAEARLGEYLFWLDLSRFSAAALTRLGAGYESSLEALTGEVVLFTKRFPQVKDLAFSDGTPFADSETRAWLEEICAGSDRTEPQAGAGPDGLEQEVEQVLGQAGELVKENQIIKAVQLLQGRLVAGGSGKARLLWRIALAQLLIGAGRPELARPHLDDLLRQMEEFNLERWDPDLALQGLKVVYQGLSLSADDQSRARPVLDRISRISPAEALKVS